MCTWHGGPSVAQSVADQISELEKASRQELLNAWVRLYGKPAPTGFRRELLVPFLAYRLQENLFGGLRPSTLSTLRQIARSLDRKRERSSRPDPRLARAFSASGAATLTTC